MKYPFGGKKSARRFDTFAGVNVEAPLWILVPKALASIFLADVLLLIIFLAGAGEPSVFFFGFLIFITVLQVLVIIGLRFQNRTNLRVNRILNPDRLDTLGAWWLVACASGALAGWICSQLAQAFPEYESFFLLLAIVFTIILPVVTMLPHLRYLETKTAYIQIPLLFFITVLPVLVGLGSLVKLWYLIRLSLAFS